MTTTTKLTLDRVVRIIVTLGLTLSVLGMPAVVPVAQAKPAVEQPVSEAKLEATPVVEATPTAAPIPAVEPATLQPVTVDTKATVIEPTTDSGKQPAFTPVLTGTAKLVD